MAVNIHVGKPYLEETVEMGETVKAIKQLKVRKALGIDDMTAEMLT